MNMKNVCIILSAILFFCGFQVSSAQEMITDSATGKAFPREVSFQSQGEEFTVQITGVSTRKKFFVKVYSVASYIQDASEFSGPNVFDDILNSDKAKQLTLIYVRNIEADKIRGGFRESFEKAFGKDKMNQLRSDIDHFLSFFGDVNTNDQQIFRWLPDGTIEVEIKGESKGSVQNEEFARALWSLWFSPRSVVKREQLVSELN